jgi:tetratricopeptide (TPR) repeat protein
VSSAKQLTIDEALSKAKKAVRSRHYSVAAGLFKAVLRQQPNHPVAKKSLRKLERKLRHGSAPVAGTPEPDAERVNELAELTRLGHMEQVELTSKKLLQEYPRSIVLLNFLGIALQRQGKLLQAVDVLDKAIELGPDVVESHSNRGIALKELGRPTEALASYDKAVALKPDFAEAHFNRGNVLQGLGQLEEATASYEKTIEIRPDLAEAHRNLSTIKRYEPDDAQIDLMERLYAATETTDTDRMELGFALAKAHEDLGNVDASFDYLVNANRRRKQLQNYNIRDDRQLFAEIKRLFAEPGPGYASPPNESESKQPLFIVGMLRSGTSLTEQILASHSQVYGAGELDAMTRLASPTVMELVEKRNDKKLSGLSDVEIDELRSAYLDTLIELEVSERIISDKMPLNFRWIGFILSAFPDAKIIHVSRDPMATCWSVYKHYFPDPRLFAYDLEDLAEYYRLYEDLMIFWRERYADSIFELNYDRLTENQEAETRKLLAFCGLGWEDQCLEFHKTERQVRTLSAPQVREPLYKGSSDAWKKYEQHLQLLVAGLHYDRS